jgi:hypothetical protein
MGEAASSGVRSIRRQGLPKYNRWTLSFEDPGDDASFRAYRINDAFSFYATAGYTVLVGAAFAVIAGGLDASNHGPSSQFSTWICLCHVILSGAIVATHHSSISPYISSDPAHVLSIRRWLQDLYIISEPWAHGGVLINRCYRGDCAVVNGDGFDSMNNFCNPYGSIGMIPYDSVFSMALFLCIDQMLFRGSSWGVIVFTWAEMLIVIVVSYFFAAGTEISANNIVPTGVWLVSFILMYAIDKNLCDSWTIRLMENEIGYSTGSSSDEPSKPSDGEKKRVGVPSLSSRAFKDGKQSQSLLASDEFGNSHEDAGRLGNIFIEENFGKIMEDVGSIRRQSGSEVRGMDRVSAPTLPYQPVYSSTRLSRAANGLSARDSDGNLTRFSPDRQSYDSDDYSDLTANTL